MYESAHSFHAQAVQATGSVLAEAPQQPQAVAPGAGTAGATLVVLLIGFYIWYMIKTKKISPFPTAVVFVGGVLMAGSVFGAIALQTSTSINQGLTTMLGTVTSSSTGR